MIDKVSSNLHFGAHAPKNFKQACKYVHKEALKQFGDVVPEGLIGQTRTEDGTLARIFITKNSISVEPPMYYAEVAKKFFLTVANSLSKGKFEK